MTKSLGSFKIRQVGNSLVITIPKNALANKDEELNLYQNENGDLVYQHPHKSNPNPWDIVSYDDIDLWGNNADDIESKWFNTHNSAETNIKTEKVVNNKAPKLGSVVLVDMNNEDTDSSTKNSKNLLAHKALFIVMSKSRFNESTSSFYGFQIHPFEYDSEFLSEPAFEPYVDDDHGINGTIDKMQLRQVVCVGYTLIGQLDANKLADLQFDLRNILDMN